MYPSKQRLLASFLPLLLFSSFSSASSDHSSPPKPCTVYSSSGSYFDLNPLSVSPPPMKDGKKVNKDDRDASWHSRGHDYGANFTINICASVIEELDDVVGVEEERWQNVSAYYKQDDRVFSIGQESSAPIFRGHKLVLNYTGGSPCPSDGATDKVQLGDGYDDSDKNKSSRANVKDTESDENVRRKSTIMSFLCDRDLTTSAAVSFVGTLDSCSYHFEVRSAFACGGVVADTDAGVGPGGVFAIIVLIAVAVYLIGGCAYQRTVMHQRGWKQCPHYGLWSGIVNFFTDMSSALCSSLCGCLNLDRLKTPHGYTHLSNGGSASGGRRGLAGAIGGRGTGDRSGRRDVDEENRLIDQLDEEWDD